jgi:uncharacterized Zn finger protein
MEDMLNFNINKKMEKKERKMKLNKKTIILLIILIVAVIIVVSIVSKHKNIVTEEYLGNISNLGLVVENENYTFYNKYEDGIVKIKGDTEYKITNETAYSMQMLGDNIYYLGNSDDGNLYIKRVKTNGDGKEIIKEVQTSLSKFYIANDEIYYAPNGSKKGISKISIETKEETQIFSATVKDFEVINEKLYYTDNLGILYKSNLDGTNVETLLSDEITEFQVYNGWIYYYNESDNTLNKLKIDGSEKKVITDKLKSFTFNICKNKIYFYDPDERTICSMNLDGSNIKTIIEISSNKTKINLTSNDEIYYLDTAKDAGSNYQMCRVKTNGGSLKEIKY